MPESWETASDAEWEDLEHEILRRFATGPPVIRQAIGDALGVEPLRLPEPAQVTQAAGEMAETLRKRARGLSLEALAAERAETPYEERRRLGQVPQVPIEAAAPQPPEVAEIHRRFQAAGEPGILAGLVGESLLPGPIRERVEQVPVVGPIITGLTTPLGLGLTAAFPAITARMAAYGAAGGLAGYGAEQAGFRPEVQIGPTTWGPRGVGELAGVIGGPTLGPALERTAMRGVAALPEITTGRVLPTVRRLALEEAGGPKPRAPKPPKPPVEPSPPADSASTFDDWVRGAPASEDAGRTFLRRYEGSISLEQDLVGQRFIEAGRTARKGRIPLSEAETPQARRLIQAIDYEGPVTEAITSAGLTETEGSLIRVLRGILDDETAKMVRQIPGFKPREWYYTHEFVRKVPKPARARGPARPRVGARPTFMRPRKLEGTALEILAREPELTLATWNPLETIERRIHRGIIYRNQTVFKNHFTRVGLAKQISQVPEEGWRVPRIGPAFESKAIPGRPNIFSEPWAVPEKLANQLEHHFGTSIFRELVPLRVLLEASSTAKYVKTFGGLFQNLDYSFRTMAQATKYGDVAMLAEIPKAWGRAYIPGLDATIRALELKDSWIQALYRHGLARQSGLGFVGREWQKAAGDLWMFKIPGIGRPIKAFGSGSFRNMHNSILTGTSRRVFRHRVLQQGMDFEKAAAQTALDMNEIFSSLPNWQSVVGNPHVRDALRTSLFSFLEQESWIRMPLRQKTFFAAAIINTTVIANLLNYVWQGEMLPLGAYRPFVWDKDADDNITGIRYNWQFLRPKLPYKGPMGRDEYLDLLGQMDTPMRLVGDPVFAAQSRLHVIPSAGMQLATGREAFGGEPLETWPERLKFLGKQAIPIPGQAVVEEMGRIGVPGAALQAVGFNVSAERLSSVLARLYEDKFGHPMEEDDPNTVALNIGDDPELNAIQEEARHRGVELRIPSAMALATYRGARDVWQEHVKTAIDANQPSDEIYGLLTEAQSDLASKADVLFEEAEWRPRGERLAEALKQYYDVELQYIEGLPDWETFFAERDAIIEATSGLEEVIRTGVAKRWTEPTVREFALAIHDARPIRSEYFNIPPYIGLTLEEGRQVDDLLARASAMVRLGLAPTIKSALVDIPYEKYSEDVWLVARRADRYRNEERKWFREEHPEELGMFEPIPLETLELVGAR